LRIAAGTKKKRVQGGRDQREQGPQTSAALGLLLGCTRNGLKIIWRGRNACFLGVDKVGVCYRLFNVYRVFVIFAR